MIATFRKGGMLWAALLVALLAGIVACSSAEPAETGPSAAEIQNIVQSAVAGIDTGSQLSAADVQKIVSDSMGSQLTAGDVQRIVDASTGGQLTAADVQKIINDSAAGQLTASDVRKIVDASAGQQLTAGDVQTIVQQSTGQQLTAADVQKIVDASASGQLTTADVQRIISASVSEAVEAANQATEAAEEASKAASGAAMAAKEATDAAMMGAMESMERMIDLPPVMAGYTRTVVSPFSFEEDVKSPRPLRPGMTLAQDQSVTVPWAGTIRHIIPGRMGSGYGRSWNQWAFMSPFITGHDLQPQAALAVAYDKNADATSYILHFDPDAVFHDGTPVTTADVKASWEFSASPEEQAPWGGIITYMKDIVGGAAVVSGDATTAEGLIPIDDHTLRVDLVRSNQLWPLEMSTSWLGVHKGHIQSQTDENWAEHPIGVGPYQVNYDPETRDVDVTPAPNWWKTDPPMPTVTYHLRHVPDRQVQEIQFRNSEVDAAFPFGDIADILLPTHDLNRDMLFRKGASAGMWFFAFDQAKPPFDDINVRKAFLHGADHKTITEALWPASFVATEIMHDGFPCGYKHEGWAYDPELAKEALAASSYGSAEALPPMTVSVFRPIIVSSAEAIQEQLKENLGITLNIEVRESGQAEGEEVGIYRRSAGAVIADPDTALAFLTHPDAPLQTGVMHGSNADKLRELWATARSMSLGEPGRCDAYQAIENEWLSSYPVMPIAGEGRLGANIGIMVQPWLRNWDHVGQNGTFFIGMPYWQIVTRDRTNAEYYR